MKLLQNTAALFLFIHALCLAAPVDTMTLKEKVGQILMVHFTGEEVNEEARILVTEVGVGGIIYYNWANGLTSPAQVMALSTGLQKLAMDRRLALPLLIAVDQEGGRVQRLKAGFTLFPSNGSLGQVQDLQQIRASSYAMAKEIGAVGVNLDLAPVVDVNSNPRNPIIGDRSFSDNPYRVAECAQQMLLGFKQAGILSTLKHYPGHGDVEVDSHLQLPLLSKSLQELERVELVPYRLLAKEVDCVMTAHILVSAFDAEKSATLSKKALSYLRNELQFKGAIITDSLVMEGVLTQTGSVDQAAIEALKAGCDILLLGGKLLNGERAGFELSAADVLRIQKGIISAVERGEVSEARLNEAVARVLALKQKIAR